MCKLNIYIYVHLPRFAIYTPHPRYALRTSISLRSAVAPSKLYFFAISIKAASGMAVGGTTSPIVAMSFRMKLQLLSSLTFSFATWASSAGEIL